MQHAMVGPQAMEKRLSIALPSLPLQAGIAVQAKIVKYIAAEEEWLRLLVHELTPVIEHLHADELPLSEWPLTVCPCAAIELLV